MVDGGKKENQQLLLVVLVFSVFLNIWQYSIGSESPSVQCQEDLVFCRRSVKKLQDDVVAKPKAAGDDQEALQANTNDCPKCPACPPKKECPPPAECNCGDKGGDKGGDNNNEGGDSPAVGDDDQPAAPAGGRKTSTKGKFGSGQSGAIGDAPEEGWIYGTDRVPAKTTNTKYVPNEDLALVKHPKRYARSPVPKGSWKVRVADNKWVTMDEVAFAYDVWFEENRIFQYASWLGVYVQQDPMDAFAIQDMLWRVKPDLIVEIGTNTGGGSIFYSTIMKAYNPNGKIVTLDVKPVSNWHKKTQDSCVGCYLGTDHPWWNDGMINFIQGRVTEKETHDKVQKFVDEAKTVIVIEDASHRYPDTLQNIEATYEWVTVGSYYLVQDTKMDRFVTGLGVKHGKYKFGPMRSVDEFVAKHPNFVIDRRFEYFLYSQHHRGWLKRHS